MRPRPLHVAALLVAAGLPLVACARRPAPAQPVPVGTPAAAPVAPATEPLRPLAGFAGQALVVMPVQRLRVADSAGVGRAAGPMRPALARLDSIVAQAVADRGVGRRWAFAADVARSARRNPTFATDPYALSVAALAARSRWSADDGVPDPLVSELRGLVALHDARYVLVPFELRTEPPVVPAGATAPAGTARVALRLWLLDARAARLVWAGETAGAPTSSFADGAAEAARRVADLIAAP